MVNDSPGLKRRPNRDGSTRHYWVASAVSKHASDYPLKTMQLTGTLEEISQRCRILTSELKLWLSNRGKGPKPIFDGSVKSLIHVYRQTPESPYHNIKHNSRTMYDESLNLLESTVGKRQLSKLTGLDFTRWYNNLKEPVEFSETQLKAKAEVEAAGGIYPENKPRQRRAYKAMQLVRIIVKFGVVANISECVRLSIILENMEFSAPPSRTQQITFEQVQAICKRALEKGRASIAVAQALQFELTLRQVDVIGQWEPLRDGNDATGIVDRKQRWSGGVAWSHINADGVLHKITTKTKQQAVHDTMAYPYLRSILDTVPAEKRIGPMVIDEASGLPYRYRHFTEVWREIADECGVPRDVWNRDSRAGGVTEGSDAGADLEHLRHHANHANSATTAKYNRHTVEKTRTVAELRVAHRAPKNAQGTGQ